MYFSIRTLAADLAISTVVVEAPDEAEARRQVEERGFFISAITPHKQGLAERRKRGISLVLFSQELLALINAGLGVVEGLEALLEKETNVGARSVFERMLASLREGRRFSEALSVQPAMFPALYVGIVRAAEGTSDLARALERYIEYRQRIDLVRGKVVNASIYPLILLAVGGAVASFLIIYVVPRFAEVYQGAGRNLPWMSQLLLGWGRFAAENGAVLFIVGLFLISAGATAVRWTWRTGSATRLLSRLPGIGERLRIFELSRLYLTLGMLAESGIPLVQAVTTVESVVATSMRVALQNARRLIEAGKPLSDAFEVSGLTTPISLRMLRVGERTGALGKMLTQSAAFYDGENGRWIDRFSRTFEPLLMAAIGLVVGAIVVLLYMPIFDLAGELS